MFELWSRTYLRPAQRAALFRAATTIPGLSTIRTTDGRGRDAIGITWSHGGMRDLVVVFDPHSYEYLDSPDIIDAVRVVDRVGRRS